MTGWRSSSRSAATPTPTPPSGPVPTITAGGTHHALVMRNNTARGDQGQMVTPAHEPVRTITTTGHQSLLVPYNRTGHTHPVTDPLGTQPATDRWALVDPDRARRRLRVPDARTPRDRRGDGVPARLHPRPACTKTHRVKLAGNAVTPPVMAWITGRLAHALNEAAR